MDRRLQLQSLLEGLLESENVYFQAPGKGVGSLKYPAIIYERDYATVQHADNLPYRRTKRYKVTVIDEDVDSSIPEKVADLPLCAFSRHFVADNLHHDIYNLYY